MAGLACPSSAVSSSKGMIQTGRRRVSPQGRYWSFLGQQTQKRLRGRIMLN
jgi:hypothetical protein